MVTLFFFVLWKNALALLLTAIGNIYKLTEGGEKRPHNRKDIPLLKQAVVSNRKGGGSMKPAIRPPTVFKLF